MGFAGLIDMVEKKLNLVTKMEQKTLSLRMKNVFVVEMTLSCFHCGFMI